VGACRAWGRGRRGGGRAAVGGAWVPVGSAVARLLRPRASRLADGPGCGRHAFREDRRGRSAAAVTCGPRLAVLVAVATVAVAGHGTLPGTPGRLVGPQESLLQR